MRLQQRASIPHAHRNPKHQTPCQPNAQSTSVWRSLRLASAPSFKQINILMGSATPPLPPQMASETQRHASRLHARLASPTLPVLLRRAPGRPRLSALLSSMALVLVAGGRGRRRRHDRPAVQGQGGQPVGEMYVLRADARGVAAEACVVSDVGRLKAREILHVIFTYQRQ